jgi:hypothetical protein
MSRRRNAGGESSNAGAHARCLDDLRDLQRQVEGQKREISFKDRLIARLRGMLGESADWELTSYQQSCGHKALVREWGRAYARAAVMICKSQVSDAEANKMDPLLVSDEADREIGALIEKDVMKGLEELGWDYAPP